MSLNSNVQKAYKFTSQNHGIDFVWLNFEWIL